MASRSPFSADIVDIFVDRLVRHELLRRALGEDPHPCLDVEAALLVEAERPIRTSADLCRRSPAWPMVKSWFCSRFRELAVLRLKFYGYSPDVSSDVLSSIENRGFDYLLERSPGESGTIPSPGSNVTFPSQWKIS